MIFKLQLVFLKKSLDNVSLDWSAKISTSCDCYCNVVIREDRSRSAGLQKHFFPARSSQGRSSVPFSALLCAGNLVNIRSTQKLSWIPLFHTRGSRMPSFWVTGTTRFESVDMICQIGPIRAYTRSWYTGTGRLKKWLQALPPLLSAVSPCFTFVFALSQFSGPNYLGAWKSLGKLSWSPKVKTNAK